MSEPSSFANFVQSAREKKKNEALAQHFLGGNRGRKAATADTSGRRNSSEKPSLLSRISGAGVQKRSLSIKPARSIEGKWQHDLHKLNNLHDPQAIRGHLSRTVSASQIDRQSRAYDKLASALNRTSNTYSNNNNNNTSGFSIRGVATGGPFVVIASNFAPGTTAADIEAVVSPHGGEFLGCRLLSASPNVMVELLFADRAGAENVIATFNNQKADGRLLYVYLKDTPASNPILYSQVPPTRLQHDVDNMDIETGGSFQDGRFGFDESGRREPPRGPRGWY